MRVELARIETDLAGRFPDRPVDVLAQYRAAHRVGEHQIEVLTFVDDIGPCIPGRFSIRGVSGLVLAQQLDDVGPRSWRPAVLAVFVGPSTIPIRSA